MNLFKAFSRVSKRSVDGVSEANKIKTLARIGQINKTVCRRGMDGSLNCSPYTPCHDICPVFSPPTEVKLDEVENELLPEPAPKTREEAVEAIRNAGLRDSRTDLMRIIGEYPLDFATAMAAFREGVERKVESDKRSEAAKKMHTFSGSERPRG
jgi:hypothetical protein